MIIDARNALDVREWQAAGWVVQAPGRHISLRRDRSQNDAPVVDSLQG